MFEDLHWADPASLDLIGYLARSGGWPGAIVVTYRSDELHRRHPLLPWIAEILRVPTVERIQLERLEPSDIEAQVAAILGAAPEPALDRRARPARRRQRVPHRGAARLAGGRRPDPADHGRHAGAPRAR